jgi:CheY-like chemotaxis protein
MSLPPPELDRFTHALLSPLTTLQGTAQLLRRILEGQEDAQLVALLGVLERNVARLRVACELLIANARLVDGRVVIETTAATFGRTGATTTSPHQAAQGAAHTWPAPLEAAARPTPQDGPVLIIAGKVSAAGAIGAALRERGRSVVEARSSTEGLDRARELRPALVLVDPHVDAQGETALMILSEDPDTKTIPLAVLGREASGGGLSHLLVNLEQPAAAAAERIEQTLVPGATGREGRPHILIVDDEPDIAEVIALQFEAEGYQTTQIYSGAEGLRIVREQQFDLILLDLLLPDLDGFTVLGGLRAQPETQLTPIILVSAINSPAEKVRGLQLGADDYITKPFSPAELSARVQAAMRRSEREGGANPSTRLPGNIAIERAISQRIVQGQPFAVCYCDIDNFKAYNDSYGFLKGDAVIQRTAQILLDTVRAYGNPDDFVGHIGGDDFVLISTPDLVPALCEAAIGRFDETAPLFYDSATRARGFISGEDRQGRPATFPLVSITITVVSSARRPFRHPGEVAQRSVEGKKRGKLMPGSVYLIEE